MYSIREFLQGKKSYLVSVLVASYAVLRVFGVLEVTPEQEIAIFALLSALFGMTISAKINRM